MRRLFTETGRYSWEANELESRICQATRPILEEFVANGYDYRDVQLIAHNAAVTAALEVILTTQYDEENHVR